MCPLNLGAFVKQEADIHFLLKFSEAGRECWLETASTNGEKRQQIEYTPNTLWIHSSTDGYLSCLLILSIVNSAAITMECKYVVEIFVFTYFGYILRSRIARLYDTYIFSFLRKLHLVFPQ